MQVTKKNLTDTKVVLTLVADDPAMLQTIKNRTLHELSRGLKIQGFREGKAPLTILEKHVDPARLHNEFLEYALNQLYSDAVEQENLRPVDRPQIKITKFVPFDTLEVEAEVEIVGAIKLPDYKKIKLAKPAVKVAAKDIDEVIKQLQDREAKKKEVKRAAKEGDETVIDFRGVDAKTKDAIAGADGKDYPLQLGSKTFIPGFEENVVGVKPGEEKTFVVTFPKDYGAKELQNKKVEFTITVKKVNELVQPKLDDAFAAKVGPFKTVDDLKADVKTELEARQQSDIDNKFSDDLIRQIADKSTVAIPESLIEEQIDRLERDQRQNIVYRGQTWQEYLAAEGFKDDKAWRDAQRDAAELRVKAGLVLSEIAEQEKIDITKEELDAQMAALATRYPDAKMRQELAKPEARRDIASRLLTEKTLAKLTGYATAK